SQVQGTSRSELAARLHRCARVCEDVASAYVERDDVHDREVVSALLLATAGLDTAGRAVDERGRAAGTALMIAATLARAAIEAAERRGLDPRLARCVAELRAAAEVCV
ncbi:MAG TPA: hypothetical protein VFL60_00785, partial [Gaiellaceae bacterium]|nr:hypothetical protein [Gaiellaceae bacterium]